MLGHGALDCSEDTSFVNVVVGSQMFLIVVDIW